jgi:hypothetical protein
MARTLVASETFTYSDGALASVSGGNWTSLNPSLATPRVTSNKFDTEHSNRAVARWTGAGTWLANQYAKITLSGLTSGNAVIGVIVRASADIDGNRDYYSAWVNENAGAFLTEIYKTVNGTETQLSSVSGDGWANGDIIEIEAEGTTIRVFRNGGLLRSVTDSDIAGSSSDRAGVIAIAGPLGDDWEGGTLTDSNPQLLLTIQDISAGPWLPSSGSPAELWQMIDGEESPDFDYDYTTSAGTMEVKFAPGSTPSVQTGHTLRYRLRGNGTCDAVIKLKVGTTVIAQWTETNVPAIDTDYEHTLDSSPSFTISDYTDLRISVEAVP